MTLPQYCRTARGNLELSHRTIKLNSRQRALLLMIDASELNGLSQQQFRHLATADNLAVLLQHQLIAETAAFASQQALYHTLHAKQEQTSATQEQALQRQPLHHHTLPDHPVKNQPFNTSQAQSDMLVENATKLRSIAISSESIAAEPALRPEGLLAVANPHSIGADPIIVSPANADSLRVNPLSSGLSSNDISLNDISSHSLDQPLDTIPDLTGQDISPAIQPAVSQPALEYLEFEQVKQLMMSSLRQYCGLLASALIKDIQYASSVTKLRLCQMRWVTTLTETRASRAQIALWVEQINFSLAERHEQHELASTGSNLTL